jgi:hypothetical protein
MAITTAAKMITVNERPLKNLLLRNAMARLIKNETPNQPPMSCCSRIKEIINNNNVTPARA